MNRDLLIKNTTLADENISGKTFDIHIRKGEIISVELSGQREYDIRTIDAKGLIAIPGLIDMHIHGAGGADSLDASKESLETISATLARYGITGFLSTMVAHPLKPNKHLKVAGEFTGKKLGGAELLGIYVEGPFINFEKKGGIAEELIAKPSPKVLDKLLEEASGALKVMTVAPEIPGNDLIIEKLTKKGVVAAFGHSGAGYHETAEGFKMGITHVTHLFNAMNPIHHRLPGPVTAILENERVSLELISDSYHVHPALIGLVWKLKKRGTVVAVSDGISGMGQPDGIYKYNNREYRSENGLAKYLDGTFIGSTTPLSEIALNFKRFTGTGFNEALESVTANPAKILGLFDRKGSIEKGKDADIVIADNSFNVYYTIVGGIPVYQKDSELIK